MEIEDRSINETELINTVTVVSDESNLNDKGEKSIK